MQRVLVCVALSATAGCNTIFGLEVTSLDPQAVPSDGLLFPPDGDTACGARPGLETWKFAPATLPFDQPGASIQHFAFYSVANERRAIVVHDNGFHDVDATGASNRITSLDPPQYATVHAPRVSTDGAALWFQQAGIAAGTYHASRASGWTKRPADLGFVNAEAIEPGSVAYYGGRARMVVSVRETGGSPRLHEIESADGQSWRALDTVRFATSGLGDRHAHLSPDGCTLVYTAFPGSGELRVAFRERDGGFTTSTKLAEPSSLTSAPSAPVFAPDAASLWFVSVVDQDVQLYRGAP